MADKYLQKEGDFAGVASGKLVTMQIPTKFTSHGLYIVCNKAGGPMTEAEISSPTTSVGHVGRIRVTINSKKTGEGTIDLFDGTAEDAFALHKWANAGKAVYTPAGVIPIPFTRDRLPFGIKPDALSIGMADVTTFTVQVQLGTPTTFIMTGMSLLNEIDKGPIKPLGEHLRVSSWPRLFATTGKENVLDLPYGEPGTALLAYHIKSGTSAHGIIDLSCKHDGENVYEDLVDSVNTLIQAQAGRTPQAGWYHVDFQRWNGLLPMNVKSFQQIINWGTAPNNYRIICEMVHGLQV